MIEPDVREVLFYDLTNMLSIESDFVPHYFSILIDKFRVLAYGHEYEKIPICDFCGSSDVIEYKNRQYCLSNYVPRLEVVDDKLQCVEISVMNPFEEHIINEEFIFPYINRVVMNVLKKLQEPSGHMMNLFVLESYLFRQDNDDFFETSEGDIRKSAVIRELYKIKRAITGYLGIVKRDIRFGATLRTPPVRMG